MIKVHPQNIENDQSTPMPKKDQNTLDYLNMTKIPP